MFLYVCLLLLPATAMAICDPDVRTYIFNHLDLNKDGEIQRAEEEEVFKRLDLDKNGCIDLKEFTSRVLIVAPKLSGHEVTIFNILDANKDGCVTKREMDALFSKLDANGNGSLDRDEFESFLNTICPLP